MRSKSPWWLRTLAVLLVLIVVVSAFALSFTVLRDLAVTSGIPASVGWLWPVVVDGTITAATLMLYTGRGGRLPLVTLIVFGLASVVGNVAHILMAQPDGAAWVIPAFIGLVPPVGLLMTVELLGGLLRVEEPAAEAEAESEAAETAVENPAPAASLSTTAVSLPAELVVAAEDARVADAVETALPTGTVPEEGVLVVGALQEAVTAPVASGDTGADTHDSACESHVVAADTVLVAEEHAVADAAAEPQPEAAEAPAAQAAAARVEEVPEAAKPAEQPAPVRQLHAVEQVPETPDEQVAWIVKKARAGVDVSSWKDLAEMFEEQLGLDLGTRTVQRRLAAAKKQDPEAFGLAS